MLSLPDHKGFWDNFKNKNKTKINNKQTKK